MCLIIDVDEHHGREAARPLRTATGRTATVSAVDAVVIAIATTMPDAVVLTSDPRDLTALALEPARTVTVVAN